MKSRILLASAFVLLSAVPEAGADGGTVIDQAESGPFRITVFASQLRAGPADLSVLVQDSATRQPILDATVSLAITARPADDPAGPQVAWVAPCCRMANSGDPTVIRATREAAQNKLLYAALTTLPASGHYEITTTVTTGSGDVRLTTPVVVAPPAAPASTYWLLLALPPVAIAGFALRSRIQRHR